MHRVGKFQVRRIRLFNVAICGILAATITGCNNAATGADVAPTGLWKQETLVPGSPFHTVNGLTLDQNGDILIASIASETIFRFDPDSKRVQTEVAGRDGRSDDLTVSSSGNLFWTDPRSGVVRTRSDDGAVTVIAEDLPGVNSIAFSPEGRLFVGQTSSGDSFWEIDPEGHQPPRRVAADTGGVNAFAFGMDGKIYGPIAHDGTIVRMDPDTGATEVVAGGMKLPVSVRWGPDNHLYALAGETGELLEIDPHTGATKLVAQVAAPVDNMVITDTGTAYVTNMADNAVIAVDIARGVATSLTHGELAFPKDIALASVDGRDVLYIADSTAMRSVDTGTGQVIDLARRMTSALQFPSGIGVDSQHVYLVSENTGSVQVVDKSTGEFTKKVEGFDHPSDVIGLSDGSLLVGEGNSGRIVRVLGEDRTVVADGLTTPTSLVRADNDSVYFAESTAGRILKLETNSGSLTEIADDFDTIRSIDVLPDGRLAVLEADSGDLWLLDPETGDVVTIASNLPIGYLQEPYARSGGIAAGSDGAVYVAADQENAIIKLTER
ncbi:DUF6923 family protein [Rhodococcus sp. NPDC127530]|uniref:Vgb family protein n=1 Tax=unclassified Rhodococcus (in: high G+C Gram-positive bacteria) TaxID=192944 RepID=UPI003637F776